MALLAVATGAIALFYGAGLTWGQHTHLVDGRILAVVGRSPVGRRILRGLRHDGHRLHLHATESDSAGHRGGGGSAVGHDLSVGRHHRHLPSPVLFRHAAASPWPGDRSSVRWKSFRWCSSASMRWKTCGGRERRRGCSATSGRSTSSSPSPSGTWSGPGCSAS